MSSAKAGKPRLHQTSATKPLVKLARLAHRKIASAPQKGLQLYLYADRRLVERYLSWDELVHFVVESKATSVSVDVFDTVLTRKVGPDYAVNNIIARALVAKNIWPRSEDDYLDARNKAMTEATSDSLLEAYETSHLKDTSSVDKAISVEESIEYKLSAPIPGAKEALEKIRSIADITFLSDMHLRSEAIRLLLERHQLIAANDRLVVSSEQGASKFGGQLFTKLWDKSQRGSVLHIGNNELTDSAYPARKGLQSRTTARANLSRYEQTIASDLNSYGPILAGAARTARLQLSPTGSPTGSIQAVGTQFIGLSIMAFLLWARQICEHQNLKQMVFLASDGELPLKMAQAMPVDHWPSTSLQSVHYNRKSWSVASASVMGVDDWIALGTTDQHAFLRHCEDSLPVLKLLERVGVPPKQATMTPFFSDVELDVALPENEVDRWHNFLADGATRQTISAESTRRKNEVVSALRQSNISSSSVPALVDIGGRGQQPWVASALFQEALDIDPLHLHFAGLGVSDLIDSNIRIHRFAFDDSTQPNPNDNAITCLEMFLSAGQPTTQQIWTGACTLAASLPSRSECDALGFSQSTDLSSQTCQLLDIFWNSPDPDEMKLLKGLSPSRARSAGAPAKTPQLVRAVVAAIRKAKSIVN